ncbi:Wzz/FepE/Etk N-terminal domain-containing protein [Clostridium sp. SYSU_GA19001]|uniref:YveK family protein n=1 Tax=Clostridium caldaquaticum TaxID=2940653 RepID=UPI002076F635|nr:Wzz/FepE/Etk N-terminal domain-containing protein [Clostridium caldaquaticum]MCM8711383.1 Wzz/FepE/Etk N-terminal domain-containing protein [Clostridium caldaquaticum]
MELQEYLSILKKRWSLIVIVTLAATLVSGIVSYFVIQPTYKSDISVIIGKQDNTASQTTSMSYNDVMMYQKLVKTYSELAKSRTVAEHTINALGIDMKVSTLQGMISVAPKGDTEFLTITVKSKDAKQAMDLANQLAKSLKAVSSDVKKVDNVQILDPAQLPLNPDSPKPLLNMAIAFFLGLMVSVGVVFLLEYLDNTVKNPDDIEKLLDIPVIGTIPFITDANK